MERVLEDYKNPLISTDAYSLAAACVVFSYSGRHRGEEEGARVLIHLLVHRLQRVRCNSDCLTVTYSSIEQKLKEMDTRVVEEHWNSSRCNSPIEGRTDDQLFLDMLDYAEGRSNVSPPPIPSPHLDCPSQHFDLVGHKIDWNQLHQTSQQIIMHIHRGCMTDYEKQIRLEAEMLDPNGKLRDIDWYYLTLIQQALTFREIGRFLPHVSCLARYRLQFDSSPKNFWRNRKGNESFTDIKYYWKPL